MIASHNQKNAWRRRWWWWIEWCGVGSLQDTKLKYRKSILFFCSSTRCNALLSLAYTQTRICTHFIQQSLKKMKLFKSGVVRAMHKLHMQKKRARKSSPGTFCERCCVKTTTLMYTI